MGPLSPLKIFTIKMGTPCITVGKVKTLCNNFYYFLTGLDGLLESCETFSYQMLKNDKCKLAGEAARCIEKIHYWYSNMDTYFCKNAVPLPVSLNDLIKIADPKKCDVLLTKSTDIFVSY